MGRLALHRSIMLTTELRGKMMMTTRAILKIVNDDGHILKKVVEEMLVKILLCS